MESSQPRSKDLSRPIASEGKDPGSKARERWNHSFTRTRLKLSIASSGQELAINYVLAENSLTSTNDPRPCTISMEGENAMNGFECFSAPVTALELA